MESRLVVSTPAIVHLCDVLLEVLCAFVHETSNMDALCDEIRTLRKFLDLIDRVFKANLPRMDFEEQHYTSVEVLLVRCRTTLSRLAAILAASGSNSREADRHKSTQELPNISESSEVLLLRARIGFYIQIFQMSLQTIKLYYPVIEKAYLGSRLTPRRVHQWKRQLPQDSIYFQHKDLAEAIQSLKESISRRKDPIANSTQHVSVEEETFLYDIDRCVWSAEVIVNVTTTTVYETVQSPQKQLSSKPPGAPGEVLVPRISDKASRNKSSAPSPKKTTDQKIREFPMPPKGSSKPVIQIHDVMGPGVQSFKHSVEVPIIFHVNESSTKRRGSFDSESESIFDPEPEFEDQFPPEVYLELISSVRREVEIQKEAGNYHIAEQTHRRAMEYLMDRERKLGIAYDNQTEMHEVLADLYVRQNKLDKAKPLLVRLLLQEEGETDRKWRLYHSLAEIYREKGKLIEAEKFAKRAYIGRERSLDKDDRLLLESVNLLVHLYEMQDKLETAEALRRVYRADSIAPPVPEKSERRSVKVVPRAEEQPGLSPSHVRWAPDILVEPSSIDAPTRSGETPLIAAIETGDHELVQLILQRGASVEARCADQITPLMHAVSHGYSNILELLLNSGAQIESATAGWTALHRAADMNNVAMVRLLLARGADIEGRSPRDFLPKKHPLARLGSDYDDYDEVDASDGDEGWTALLRAATNGQEAMVRLLIEKGADIEARSPSNGTPLICAAEGNYGTIVEFLLQNGANVNAEDQFGWKPLHRVMVSPRGEGTAQMLLSRGADINARCSYQKTPLHHAIEKRNDTMVSFLLTAGADYEARDIAERTPLHTAIESRLENMVHLLLEAGADADAKDKGGHDALEAANRALRRSPEITSLLSKHKKAMRNKAAIRQSSVSSSLPSRSGSSSSWWSMRSNKQKKRE